MTPFTTVDRATGQVLSRGIASDPSALETDEVRVFEGIQAPETVYFDTPLWRDIPPRPSPHHTWAWDSKTWAAPALDTLRAAQWKAIKIARSAFEFGGFTWDGSAFDSDSKSQSRIMGAAQLATLAQLAGEPFAIDWTLADNAVRSLSAADMLAVGRAMGVHIATAHATGRVLRAALEDATTPEAIAAISWP